MRPLSLLGRLLPVLALVAATIGLGASSADASTFARSCKHPKFVISGNEGGRSIGQY